MGSEGLSGLAMKALALSLLLLSAAFVLVPAASADSCVPGVGPLGVCVFQDAEGRTCFYVYHEPLRYACLDP